MVKRFVDNNWSFYTYAYDQKIWVKCPKCNGLAFVWHKSVDKEYFVYCICTSCLFRVNHNAKRLFIYRNYWQVQDNLQGYEGECNVLIDQNCPCKEGKFRFLQTYPHKSQIPNVITLYCNFCHQAKTFSTKSEDVHIKKNMSFSIEYDPILHYPLYLCESTNLGKIFVFNPEQLAQLKSYISADLRENTTFYNGYFSKLPTWIKSAKNRDLVLKAISKLEQKVLTHSNENVK